MSLRHSVNIRQTVRGVLREWFMKCLEEDAFPYVDWAVKDNEPRRITIVYEVRPEGENISLICVEHYSQNLDP